MYLTKECIQVGVVFVYTNFNNNNPVFGWNIKTHLAITEEALKDNPLMPRNLQRYVARASELPDLDPRELVDLNSAHFYDVLHEDPSYGSVNDAKNNAMSRFLSHTQNAKKAAQKGDIDGFLKAIGYASHYLQDGGTPPHTEHGNYFHKLLRIPMHTDFERGEKRGATARLDILRANFTPEVLPFSTLKMLFHNTALFTVQPENLVRPFNKRKWPEIQQRCFDRCVNATKVYMDYILQYMPKLK